MKELSLFLNFENANVFSRLGSYININLKALDNWIETDAAKFHVFCDSNNKFQTFTKHIGWIARIHFILMWFRLEHLAKIEKLMSHFYGVKCFSLLTQNVEQAYRTFKNERKINGINAAESIDGNETNKLIEKKKTKKERCPIPYQLFVGEILLMFSQTTFYTCTMFPFACKSCTVCMHKHIHTILFVVGIYCGEMGNCTKALWMDAKIFCMHTKKKNRKEEKKTNYNLKLIYKHITHSNIIHTHTHMHTYISSIRIRAL